MTDVTIVGKAGEAIRKGIVRNPFISHTFIIQLLRSLRFFDRFWSFLLSGLFFSSLPFSPLVAESYADDAEVPLEESFILFRVQNSVDSFYRVMMDLDEKPYVDIEDLFNWLEMKSDCDIDRRYCQAVMQPKGRIFWIDGEQGEMGDSDQLESIQLPADSFFQKEGKLWLRYDAWQLLLPAAIIWSVDRYYLSVEPHFPLQDDRKAARERSRDRQNVEKARRERLANLTPLQPSDPYAYEVRYFTTLRLSPEASVGLDAGYDLSADLYRGHLQVSGAASTDGETDAINYWVYRQRDRGPVHLMEFGHTQFQSLLLLPSFSLTSAIRVDQRPRAQGAGTFEYFGNTDPGAEVDVYIGGFLEETLVADEQGNYEIEKRFVAGGDRIVLEIFLPDGSEEEEIIEVAPDNSLLLKPQRWDNRFVSGNSDEGRFSHYAVRYGVIENVSAGLHIYDFPSESLLVSNDRSIDPDRLPVGVDINWRPLTGMNILLDLFESNQVTDYGLQIDLSFWHSHTLQLSHQALSETSWLTNNSLFTYDALRTSTLLHGMSISRWKIFSIYTDTPMNDSLEVQLDYRVRRDLSFSSELTLSRQQDDQVVRSGELGFQYQFSDRNTVEVSRIILGGNNTWAVSGRYQGRANHPFTTASDLSPWRIVAQANAPDSGRTTASLNFAWFLTSTVSGGVSVSEGGGGLQLTWQQAHGSVGTNDNLLWPLESKSYNDFSAGTLTGYVYAPPTPGEPREPLSQVTVMADSRSAVTDEQGYYRITGLPAFQRIPVRVNNATLDASMAAAKELELVELRPSTRIGYNPSLVWTAGVDGVVYTDRSIPPSAEVSAYLATDERLVATALVESDGFFMLEGLTPGDFILRLEGVDVPPEPMKLEIPEGVDWVSAVQIRWLSEAYLQQHPEERSAIEMPE